MVIRSVFNKIKKLVININKIVEMNAEPQPIETF